jgi:tmRNA-binding protein
VKSIKTGKINIKDAIVRISNNELFIINMDIPLYAKSSIDVIENHENK